MQVRKKLRINVTVSVITAVIIVLMLFLSLYRISHAMEELEIADKIAISAFQRNTFRNDYLRTGSERAKVQWFTEHDRMSILLKSASEKFRDAEDKKNIADMIEDNETTGKLFSVIVDNREQMGPGEDLPFLYQELEDRLVSQLDMRLYDKVLYSRRLQEAARGGLFAALRLAGWGIFLVIAVLTPAAIINSWAMGRTITDRIGKLRDGASVIGEGNLDYRIDIKGNDEFTDLSGSFNTMTAKLHGSYLDLENEVAEHKRTEDALRKAHDELEAANKELESFSYSVSHDLRAPLRIIDGFSKMILEDYAGKLDEEGKDLFRRTCAASQRMGLLIDGLLNLSSISRSELVREKVDLSAQARDIAGGLKKVQPARKVEFVIADGLVDEGDGRQLYVVLQNLLGNAWKFTEKKEKAQIEFGVAHHDGKPVYFVSDDGAGFDMAYINKLFGPFQRLHSAEDFLGIGIGLATVQRIIHRHGGRIWAEGEVEKGATFHFTLHESI